MNTPKTVSPRSLALAAALAIAAVPAAQAALLTYEGFNYTSGATLTGSNGGSGWRASSGTWGTSGTSGTVANAGLSYANAGYAAGQLASLPTAGLALTANNNNRFLPIDAGTSYDSVSFDIRDGANRFGAASEGASGNINGVSLFGSFLVQSSDWSSARMLFELNDNGASTTNDLRIMQNDAGSTLDIRDGNSADLSANSSTLTGTNTYLIVWKLAFSSAAAGDNLTFWVNPTGGASEASGGISLTATRDHTFNNIVLRGLAGNVVFDELRLGTTWADVAPSAIPEPSTFAALAGLGVLGLAATRRRRAR